jgi:hypothetical protein
VAAIRDPDPALRVAAGRALGVSGVDALEDVLAALTDPACAGGDVAAVRALEGVETPERVRAFAAAAGREADRYRRAALGVPPDGDVGALLADALVERGRRIARAGLWALSISTSDREAVEAAIENLEGDGAQVPAALETLESSADRRLVAPLLGLWDPPSGATADADGWRPTALGDDDALIRATAELLIAREEGSMPDPSNAAMSLVERVLHLRSIPLLADLAPSDLERVAGFAEERTYTDGETIGAEGELGDELHLIVEGDVRIVRDAPSGEVELVRRTRGDVIGELSLITREPRVASLVAAGEVRTIRIGRREFESLLRERPDVGLAVMRVLAHRVAETATTDPG